MKKYFAPLAMAAAVTAPAQTVDLDVEITNLTRGSFFTPFLVTAHVDSAVLFTVGQSIRSLPLVRFAAEGHC